MKQKPRLIGALPPVRSFPKNSWFSVGNESCDNAKLFMSAVSLSLYDLRQSFMRQSPAATHMAFHHAPRQA